MSNTKDLALLFQRPYEPIFGVKSDETGKVRVDVPPDYYTEKYQDVSTEIQSRFGEDDVNRTVPVSSRAPPNLDFAEELPRKKPFCLFNRKHTQIAGRLIEIFLDAPDTDTLFSYASYAHDRVNPQMYQYSLSVAMQHRADTQNTPIPSVAETFPNQFVDPEVLPQAREENAFVPDGVRRPIVIPPSYTASEREEEQRLAYFREDIGVNLHHWHWHLVYPGDGPERVVRKDRRGELFYYMHAQIIARYNIERLCNRLARVRRLNNLREAVPEGYFPKLSRSSNNQTYPPRFADVTLKDIDRPEDNTQVQISDLEGWRDRILQAIDQGYVETPSGQRLQLDESRGIDLLGDMIEASILSPNPRLYGNLHNMGHNVIAYNHDPDNRFLEQFGVMGDVTTAMRDPIFYRWHAYIDQIFQKHKNTLQPYTPNVLSFDGVTVQSVACQMTQRNTPANVILTYWQRGELNLGAGLDFGPQGNVFAQFTHLQHAPFSWRITVNNDSGATRQGTCRIFMCPRTDERGMPFTFRDQRVLMIEMDRFTVNLSPGVNTINRRDEESNVTIPYDRTFRNIGTAARRPLGQDQFNFCGCGWPNHLLVPKGSPEGFTMDTFVMISNFNDDTVNENIDASDQCSDSYAFCGIRNKLYPDRRAMGFPFDRNNQARTLQDFANQTSNMGVGECSVRFTNTYVART
ncbi:phenoloxidase subunit 1-like [Phlebotomus argentipes]|uniref:phenoloxidase subunit 1-like n=1 Tax=Phlebotomus argentipes TaxID=94469 RepID=UPI0028932B59|nr:phenoloxidase subunit 1-like [Phlebotomus argentipes]